MVVNFFQRNRLKAFERVYISIVGCRVFFDKDERADNLLILNGGRGLRVGLLYLLMGEMLFSAFTGFLAQWYYLQKKLSLKSLGLPALPS